MGSWLARWRAVLRIARRDAARRKARTAVVVAMLMLPVFAGTALTTVMRSSIEIPATMVQTRLGDQAQAQLQPMECNWVQQHPSSGASMCEGGEEARAATVEEMAAVLPSGTELVPEFGGSGQVRTDQALVEVSWSQVDTAAVPGQVRARTGSNEPESGEVVVDSRTAGRLGAEVGSEIELVLGDEVIDLHLVGLSAPQRSGSILLGAGSVPTENREPAHWLALGAPVTWEHVQSLNEHGVLVVSRQVVLDPPPAQEIPAGFDTGPQATTIAMVGAVAAIGLVQAVLLIGPAFAVGARASTRSLALVAAGGGRPRDLHRIVLSAGLVTGALAGLAGVVLGLGAGVAAYLIVNRLGFTWPNLVLPTWELAALAGLALLIGLVAAWIPARGAARTDVVAALTGQRSEAAPRKRIPWLGVGLAVAGVILAALGAARTEPVLLIAGVLAIQLGLVMASGGLVALTARMAPRLKAPLRFALRDAQRQRGRTAPAVAAVLVAVAGVTTAMSYLSSEDAAMTASWEPDAEDGTGYLHNVYRPDRDEHEAILTQAISLLEDHRIPMQVTAARILSGPSAHDRHVVWAEPDPDTICPGGTEQERAEDPRCQSGTTVARWNWINGTLVDDGTMISATGLPGTPDAAESLTSGVAVVNNENLIWPDGSVRVAFMPPGADWQSEEPHVVEWPAHFLPSGSWTYDLVLPPQILDEFDLAGDDVQTTLGGALIQPEQPFTQEQVDTLNRELAQVHPNLSINVEGWQNVGDSLALSLILAGLAMLVALAATGLSVGLAAAESRPDLATLAAVGAGPRLRRKIAGAQAGVIVVIGTATGTITGLVLSYVLGLWQQQPREWGSLWQFTVPWLVPAFALGLPLLAIGGAMALTRSRLPVVRRMA